VKNLLKEMMLSMSPILFQRKAKKLYIVSSILCLGKSFLLICAKSSSVHSDDDFLQIQGSSFRGKARGSKVTFSYPRKETPLWYRTQLPKSECKLLKVN